MLLLTQFGNMSDIFASVPDWLIPVFILLLSVFALTVILERAAFLLRGISLLKSEDERKLLNFLREKKFDDAASFCRLQKHPAYQVSLGIIEMRKSHIDLTHIADEETLNQMQILEKYLPTLGTISTVAPLLGLLGTVTGMIKAFKSYAMTENAQMMGGIDEALITTALGLIVAIPSLIMYNFYVKRVNLLLDECDVLSRMVVEELKKNG